VGRVNQPGRPGRAARPPPWPGRAPAPTRGAAAGRHQRRPTRRPGEPEDRHGAL